MKTVKRAFLLILILALTVFSSGCFNFKMNFSTAAIEEAIMTETVDADGVPGAAVTSFPADAAMLYTSAKLTGAPDNTRIRVVWTYVTGSQTVDEVTIDSGTIADRWIYSSLKPEVQLPEGDYKVDYYIGDHEQPDATVTFTVVAPAVTDVASLVKDAHMTSFIDENGLPVDTITSVPTSGVWYVYAALTKAMPDSVITIYWFDLNDEVVSTTELPASSNLNISAAYELPAAVAAGEYHVAIYVGTADKPSVLVTFTAA
ncbi:MAG TPA: hypothetical protein PKH29_12430 [Oscillospiraceae bacterium]|nr:hypothetical protein [Oscillospiraceae bacterium]